MGFAAAAAPKISKKTTLFTENTSLHSATKRLSHVDPRFRHPQYGSIQAYSLWYKHAIPQGLDRGVVRRPRDRPSGGDNSLNNRKLPFPCKARPIRAT